jgi:putative DNA primase/helicase
MWREAETGFVLRLQECLLARRGRREGREIRFCCPAHEDSRPSARWNPGKKTWFCDACQAGGGWRDLAARLGLEVPAGAAAGGGRIVAAYPYRDSSGRVLFEVVRREPKGFAARRPDGAGGWLWNLQGVERVLYRLPEILAAVRDGRTVWVVEGEKDAEALAGLGLEATTNPGGAGKWRAHHAEPLQGASVVIVPDNDAAGRRHAAAVAASLAGIARDVCVLALPDLPARGDVSDWLAARREAGGEADGLRRELLKLAGQAPPWRGGPLPEGRGGGVSAGEAAGGGGAETGWRRVADIAPERVRFLWYPYIPLGKITLLDGDPGQGKSWLAAALAASGSRGMALPGAAEGEPWASLLFTQEDGLADTLRPRLDALAADCARIWAFDRPLSLALAEDVEHFERLVERCAARLVVIDPLVAYIGARTDIYRANEVRAVLAPLARVAERKGCAILAIRHLNKVKAGRSIYAGQGSIAFTGTARSVLLVGCAPDDPREHALVHLKSNLAPHGRACAYRLENGRFRWTGTSRLSAPDLLAAESPGAERSAEEEARGFLRAVLAGDDVPAQAVWAAARQAGIAERTLKRAKHKEGIEVLRRGFGSGSVWLWRRPGARQEALVLDFSAAAGREGGDGGGSGEGGHAHRWPPSRVRGPLRDVGLGFEGCGMGDPGLPGPGTGDRGGESHEGGHVHQWPPSQQGGPLRDEAAGLGAAGSGGRPPGGAEGSERGDGAERPAGERCEGCDPRDEEDVLP